MIFLVAYIVIVTPRLKKFINFSTSYESMLGNGLFLVDNKLVSVESGNYKGLVNASLRLSCSHGNNGLVDMKLATQQDVDKIEEFILNVSMV